eukprot:1158182-Pelagomonas_calceolata.AAC.4
MDINKMPFHLFADEPRLYAEQPEKCLQHCGMKQLSYMHSIYNLTGLSIVVGLSAGMDTIAGALQFWHAARDVAAVVPSLTTLLDSLNMAYFCGFGMGPSLWGQELPYAGDSPAASHPGVLGCVCAHSAVLHACCPDPGACDQWCQI